MKRLILIKGKALIVEEIDKKEEGGTCPFCRKGKLKFLKFIACTCKERKPKKLKIKI